MFEISKGRILAISPHLDDVELGAGATLHSWSKKNDIYYLGLSIPPDVKRESFLKEFWESSRILKLKKNKIHLEDYDPRNLFNARSEILQLFFDFNTKIKPDIVLVPNSHDIHQSHAVVYQEACRVFKNTNMFGYELPWNNLQSSQDIFITITKDDVDAKVKAINAFASQKHRVFFSNDIVGDLTRVRGKQINREYAECFELIRMII
jgi:N-acetylglucosamine malate deacetylase 1